MSDRYNIIAMMGPAGSGKDTIIKAMVTNKIIPNLQPIIGCTTRPIREGEQDGVNYHFLTNEQFADQVINGEMLEATCFNNWHYGTSIKDLNKNAINIGVYTPEAIDILREYNNINLFVAYIIASDKTRLLRQLNREKEPNCDEIVRRYTTDKKDFEENYIYSIIQPNTVIINDYDKSPYQVALQLGNDFGRFQINI